MRGGLRGKYDKPPVFHNCAHCNRRIIKPWVLCMTCSGRLPEQLKYRLRRAASDTDFDAWCGDDWEARKQAAHDHLNAVLQESLTYLREN